MGKLINSDNLRITVETLSSFVTTKLDGKSFKYLTFDEYESLPKEEKNNENIVYMITDYEDVLAFDTSEIVLDSTSSSDSEPVLGQGKLNRLKLK